MNDERVRRLSRLHRIIYRATGGVIGRRLVANEAVTVLPAPADLGRMLPPT